MIFSTINTAVSGMHANQARFLDSASKMARFGAPAESGENNPISMEDEIVGVLTSRRGYEANLSVVKAADEMLGTLLDTFA